MSKPKKTDIDNDEDDKPEGEESAVKQMRAKLADKKDDAEPDDKEPKDGEIRVQVSDDDDDDDDDEARPSRRERRRQRYQDVEARAQQAEERARLADERAARLEQQFATMQRPAAPPQQQPQRTELDEVGDQLQSIQREYMALHSAGKLTQADYERLNAKHTELNDRRTRLVVQSALPQQRPAEDPMWAHMRAKHYDVMSNPVAKQFAHGEYMRRAALAGGRLSQADEVRVLEEAMTEARRQYKIGKPPPSPSATESQRAKYEAPPRGGAGSGGARTVRMGKEEQKMANAMYAHITDEGKRYQMWARNVGSKLKEKAG